jgi:hypothetical protein
MAAAAKPPCNQQPTTDNQHGPRPSTTENSASMTLTKNSAKRIGFSGFFRKPENKRQILKILLILSE